MDKAKAIVELVRAIQDDEKAIQMVNEYLDCHGRVTVDDAARAMHKSAEFVRVALQKGVLPIGTAVQVTGNRYSYYISPKLLKEYIGG